jgi:hypothetical protein
MLVLMHACVFSLGLPVAYGGSLLKRRDQVYDPYANKVVVNTSSSISENGSFLHRKIPVLVVVVRTKAIQIVGSQLPAHHACRNDGCCSIKTGRLPQVRAWAPSQILVQASFLNIRTGSVFSDMIECRFGI